MLLSGRGTNRYRRGSGAMGQSSVPMGSGMMTAMVLVTVSVMATVRRAATAGVAAGTAGLTCAAASGLTVPA